MRNPMPRAELHHPPRPRHTKPRFQRSRLVINAAVDHPAIVSRLVPRHSRLFLQNHHPQPGKPLAHLHGKRKPNNPPANHRNIISHKSLVSGRPCGDGRPRPRRDGRPRPSNPCAARQPTEDDPTSPPRPITVTQEQENVTQEKGAAPLVWGRAPSPVQAVQSTAAYRR